MKRILFFMHLIFAALFLTIITGCSSTGYSGSAGYHRSNDRYDDRYYNNRYDRYYRSGVNRHYNRTEVKNKARARAKSSNGAAASRVRASGRARR